MPNMIWQVGKSGDEAACAKGLQDKHGARIVRTQDPDIVGSFAALTKNDRLQIVADFNIVTGAIAGGLTPQFIAELLVLWGLREARLISLVICNSAVDCVALGRTTLAQRLKERLIQSAKDEKVSLFVGALSGRTGYVNVYTKVMENDLDVYFNFIAENREREVGRKYVFTEPTTASLTNKYLPKGANKIVIGGIDVKA